MPRFNVPLVVNSLITQSYFGLQSAASDCWDLVKEAYEDARKSWLCTGCCNPKPEVRRVDAIIYEVSDSTPINFINGTTVGVARKDFLSCLGDKEVAEHLSLGRVFLEDGELLNDWVTFIGNHKIIVRGTKEAATRNCSICGSQPYFALPPYYLYPAPPPDIAIFDKGTGGLVVTELLKNRIAIRGWPKLKITQLSVLDAPRDGLGLFQP